MTETVGTGTLELGSQVSPTKVGWEGLGCSGEVPEEELEGCAEGEPVTDGDEVWTLRTEA